jgi:hypothetical protein
MVTPVTYMRLHGTLVCGRICVCMGIAVVFSMVFPSFERCVGAFRGLGYRAGYDGLDRYLMDK